MDAWQTYTFEFNGGLVSNLSPLQHGTALPGSARTLRNFEPSIDGGYRRIEGYEKYDSSFIPLHGSPVIQGSSQTGTVLAVGNIFSSPSDGNTFTIDGVTGTYTIAAGGVVFSDVTKSATLTLTTSLDSSPADQASISFSNKTSVLVEGLVAWKNSAVAVRDGGLYRSTGNGWTRINVPSYGTTLVNGAGQTGTTITVDGLTATPHLGDTFTIGGIQKIYTVTAPVTVTSGSATITIFPALASSPADNAEITWVSYNLSNGIKTRFDKYRINGTDYIVGVDGVNYPFKWNNATLTVIDGLVDVAGSSFVSFFKNQMFYGKGDTLYFTAPYTDNDFSAANGAGLISVGNLITGIIPFRETLIIFTQTAIYQLTGNTSSDFSLQPITRNIGCVSSDTIQEIGGDIMFLGPEGLRLLSATDRIGDFNLGVASKEIQSEMTSLISASPDFSSVVIKEKSQYRLFGYNQNIGSASAIGVIATQRSGDTSELSWAEIVGFKAYVADSDYVNQTETVLFANARGYVYQMEQGNSLDGEDIYATYATPYVYINDARIRKTFYRLNIYADPQGSVTALVNLKYDFDTQNSVQPRTITFSNVSGAIGLYGEFTATYGTAVYGTKLKKIFSSQVIGSGFFVSLQFTSAGTNPPFSLDAATLEFSSHDRR